MTRPRRQPAHAPPLAALVRIDAPAKLNLTLAVGPRRDDGFHAIESLMAPLDLCDELAIEPIGLGGPELIVEGPRADATPAGPDNLVCRAARLLADSAGRPPAVRIRLTKRIWVGGGLGGGSSDAAATLVGLNGLWELGASREQLADLAAELGSDVPFFLAAGPARVSGRGECVEPLAEPLPPLWALLIAGPGPVSTAAVYARLDRMRAQKIAPKRCDMRLAGLSLFNELAGAALAESPPLADLFDRLERTTGLGNLTVAGSGSTLCAIFDDPSEAEQWRDRVRMHVGCEATVAAVRTAR